MWRGEYVLVAPIETAQIVSLDVRRGDPVRAGQPLGRLERRDAEIAVAQAEAALTQAESQLANLQQGAPARGDRQHRGRSPIRPRRRRRKPGG